ncbi:hypothetical protein TNIN_197761 [Trichonephila inaurata madagascariensis]|uniref:Uncharacterized protein n=1 Tax=Trichonephila inaurata madagascariensis TaxID=2747483 RepID=A0A8X7CIQ1_9ARAC|nr:hypothetical protein TNIN_197761 [Trichonephila inaurata madagascariensis]
MAFCSDQRIDMDFQHVSLPTFETLTAELPVDPTPCAKLQVTKADIKRSSYVKDQMYRSNPNTTTKFEQYISDAYQTISTEMFTPASENFVHRRHRATAKNGGYYENVVL